MMAEVLSFPTGTYCLDHNPYCEKIDPEKYLSSLLDLAHEQTIGQLWKGVNKVLNLKDVPHALFSSGTSMRFIPNQSKGPKKSGRLLMTKSLQDNGIAVSIDLESTLVGGRHSDSTFKGPSEISRDEILNFFLSYYFMSLGSQKQRDSLATIS